MHLKECGIPREIELFWEDRDQPYWRSEEQYSGINMTAMKRNNNDQKMGF